MLKWIVLALIIVPLLEIASILAIGDWLGLWPTVALLIITSVVGGSLARQEGRIALRHIREKLARGEAPAQAVVDGVCVLIGGILLLTPGFFTDMFGFLLLFPLTRPVFRKLLLAWIVSRLGTR